MGSRAYALIMGIAFTLIGILGFIPNLVAPPGAGHELAVTAGYGYLLGLVPTNVLHNLVRLGVGVWGLASYSSFPKARFYAQSIAIVYGLFALMGLIPALNTTFGLIPIYGSDILVHSLTALMGTIVGFMTPPIAADVEAEKEEKLTSVASNR